MPDSNGTVGERLASLRPDGMLKKKFAETLGLTGNGLADRVNGRTKVGPREIQLACLKYHVLEPWLRSGEGPRDRYLGIPVLGPGSAGRLPGAPDDGDRDVLEDQLRILEGGGVQIDTGTLRVIVRPNMAFPVPEPDEETPAVE